MDTSVADPLLNALLDGRYRIRARVAGGGMATVYQAVDERLERVVAVKVITPAHAGNAEFLRTFDREAKTIAQLSHPNVVAVYDTGEHEGLPYLVMEYVQGRTLREVLVRRGKLRAVQAVEVTESLLSALAAAHRTGVVHRDVKPENVLIREDGTIKVADFGLAHAVEASSQDPDGQLMATAAYVPPEVVTEGRADPRSDVYSAGIVLFEMLTGQVPYAGERSVDVAYQHVEHDVPPPSRYLEGIPVHLDDLVVRATRRDPAARPVDAGAFLAEVRAVRDDLTAVRDTTRETQPTRAQSRAVVPVPVTPRATTQVEPDVYYMAERYRPPRRRVGLVIAAVVVVLGLVAALAGWWLGAGRYTTAPSLLRLDKEQAVTTAERMGFEIEYGEHQYSEEIPKDAVLEQDPGPHERIVRGGTITLVLSLGEERYTVPNLVGDSRGEAVEELEKRKLVPTFEERYHDSVPEGDVISTKPKAGTEVRPNTTVKVVVSRGEAPVTVPDVTGEHVDVARAGLEDAGLVVVVQNEPSAEIERDHVIRQAPEPGTGMERGGKVTLVVSSGPRQVEVPDVVGEERDEAVEILQAAGFEVDVYEVPNGDGIVRTQSPGGGDTADEGSTVILGVS